MLRLNNSLILERLKLILYIDIYIYMKYYIMKYDGLLKKVYIRFIKTVCYIQGYIQESQGYQIYSCLTKRLADNSRAWSARVAISLKRCLRPSTLRRTLAVNSSSCGDPPKPPSKPV